jgi:DNA-binding GntR family transcriptional regulator
MNIFREIAIFGIVRGLVRKAFLALVAAALLCVERGSAFIPPRGPE